MLIIVIKCFYIRPIINFIIQMNRLFTILIIALLFVSKNIMAQCPPNIGFEDGTLNNWETYAGEIDGTGAIFVTKTTYTGNRQTIFKKGVNNEEDMYGHFPVVCPNGSGYSLRLGNDVTGRGAERVSYTYEVPPGKTITLVLNYAVVLGDPLNNHTLSEQPRFTAKVYNVTDNALISCPAFDFTAATGPGFGPSDVSSPSTGTGGGGGNSTDNLVQFKGWSATTINLEGYGGKTIRLEFTTNDCSKGGHFGYAYLDIDETCDRAITGNNYCEGQTEVTLHGPGGFADYKWYLGPTATGPVISTTQTMKVPVPPDGTQYTLAIEPYLGLGCSSVLSTTVNKLATPFNMVVKPLVVGCAGQGVNLKDASITDGSSSDIVFSYHKDPVTLDYIYKPEYITEPGIYYIKGTNAGGCTDIKAVEVKFNAIPTTMSIDAKTVQYPGTADITMPNASGLIYSYFKDAAATIPLTNYNAVDVSGTYYVQALSTATGCNSMAMPVKVAITAPAPFVLTIPNVFTPNSDGVNDLLNVNITGYLTFGNLKVFNRYGGLLYTAKSQSESWAGTFNGHALPVGTYYWIFEGTDSYYKTPVRKSGSVAIIR